MLHITFGRFQPPTIAHQKLFERLQQQKQHLVFVSRSYDREIGAGRTYFPQNPLKYEDKIHILDSIFPNVNFVDEPKITSPWHSLKYLSDLGVKDVTFYCGQDRLKKFEGFKKYLDSQDPRTRLNFTSLTIESIGNRRARETEHHHLLDIVCASHVRNLACQGYYKEFRNLLPSMTSSGIALKIYNLLREEMDANSRFDTGSPTEAKKKED